MTLDALIDKHNVKHIDFLKIDIEGIEYVVLDAYSWKVKPNLIKMEANWVYDDDDGITRNEQLIPYWEDKLKKLGYHVYQEENDWYCILAE